MKFFSTPKRDHNEKWAFLPSRKIYRSTISRSGALINTSNIFDKFSDESKADNEAHRRCISNNLKPQKENKVDGKLDGKIEQLFKNGELVGNPDISKKMVEEEIIHRYPSGCKILDGGYIINCKEESLMSVSLFKLLKVTINKKGTPVSMKKVRGGIYIETKDSKQAKLLMSITRLLDIEVATIPNDRLNLLHGVVTCLGY